MVNETGWSLQSSVFDPHSAYHTNILHQIPQKGFKRRKFNQPNLNFSWNYLETFNLTLSEKLAVS